MPEFLNAVYSRDLVHHLRIMDSNWISLVSVLLFESRLLWGRVKTDLEQASWPSLEKVLLIPLMNYFHVDDCP